jgi:NAD(P)-dependent dehydrogenase (short-subunit alcohol dehydrogenase family)
MVEAVGRRGMTVPTDVAEQQDCQRLVDETVRELGRVNVLVNNAGIGTAVSATRETVEQFGSVIDENLNGCY